METPSDTAAGTEETPVSFEPDPDLLSPDLRSYRLVGPPVSESDPRG